MCHHIRRQKQVLCHYFNELSFCRVQRKFYIVSNDDLVCPRMSNCVVSQSVSKGNSIFKHFAPTAFKFKFLSTYSERLYLSNTGELPSCHDQAWFIQSPVPKIDGGYYLQGLSKERITPPKFSFKYDL